MRSQFVLLAVFPVQHLYPGSAGPAGCGVLVKAEREVIAADAAFELAVPVRTERQPGDLPVDDLMALRAVILVGGPPGAL